MNLTDLEKIVYEAIKEECKYNYCSDVKTISETTNLKINTIKGVIGSLTKKDLIECETDTRDDILFHDIFAIVDGELWSYAVENEQCKQ